MNLSRGTSQPADRSTRAVSEKRADIDRGSYGVALKGRLGYAYDEDAFRYLLMLERKRSERSGRPFLLLLVDLQEEPGATVRIDPAAAATIFSDLWRSVRETDFVGWYREERVAGAVLTPVDAEPGPDTSRHVADRVTAALRNDVPPILASRVRVNVYQLGARVKS
jgi:hypothetical protein